MTVHNKYPKISIVTPSLNQGAFLEAAITSVISQGYPNLEYIIVDGGSSDNSIEIIEKYSKYLHFWCSEPDGGHYAAVNKGFGKATGDIYAWLNSDDMYCPDALKTVGSIFYNFKEVTWLTTLQQRVWDRYGRCKSIKRIPGYSRDAFLDGQYITRRFSGLGYIQQESTFWRRDLWERVNGIRTLYNLAGDFDLWARFFIHENLYGVDHPLGGFRVHDKNRSLDHKKYLCEVQQALEEVRLQLNWPNRIAQPVYKEIFRKLSRHKWIAKLVKIAPERNYVGSIISKTSLDQEEAWQKTTVCF